MATLRAATHLLRFQSHKLAERAKAPLWKFVWNTKQQSYGGDERFPTYDSFLESTTDVYKYLQNELLTAENTRHLEDLCTEELWPVVRATGAEYGPLRQQFQDECRIHWTSIEAFVCAFSPPDEQQEVFAGARFFSIMNMAFVPNGMRRSIDDVLFKSTWDADQGVSQWRIAHIGGPITPSM
eukprot:TRINITY_DN76632_c0_g1_i1.p1 TRINITY_DN76632_c0_g1~~TRINITY_DN76632_c0_g1_i1.p1  ORF type:complete len:182 (-),score=24.28 TRINITY_DN76632_c0_g1_i1:184-729(-)